MKVSLIAAMTLCGRISPGSMGSAEDRAWLEEMRAATDASLLGAATLREGEAEMRGPQGVLPLQRIRAVITASGELPWERRLFCHHPRPLIFTGEETAAKLQKKAGERAEVIALPKVADGALSLASALEHLAGRGVRHLLLEGGGRLNFLALAQGVVDELLVTITPKLSGNRHVTTLADGDQPLGDPFLDLSLLSCRRAASGELFCHYRVRKNRV